MSRTTTELDTPERLTSTRVPESAEVAAYKRGLAEGKEAKSKGEKKGFITSLLDDLVEAIDKSDEEKKKALTAKTKVPTMETVVHAFDAAADVTAANSEAHAQLATNPVEAARLQQVALDNFLALDPLVREGALLVLYVQAEAEYRNTQVQAGYTLAA
jgi:hypothetical protein